MYVILTNNEELVNRATLNGDNVFKSCSSITSSSSNEIANKTPEKIISDFLLLLGIEPYRKGFAYLKCAIEYCLNNSDKSDLAIIKDIYGECTKKFKVPYTRIERNIRSAIASGFKNCPEEFFNVYERILNSCPTNSSFVKMAVTYIKQNLI